MKHLGGILVCATLLLAFAVLALSGALSHPEDPKVATLSALSQPPSATSTPAEALVMQECAKAVLDGVDVVTMRHFARIDDCAARVRAAILTR